MAERKRQVAEAAQHVATLRAVAENPLVRPSVRVEARRALKALLPPPKRYTGHTTRARHDWPADAE